MVTLHHLTCEYEEFPLLVASRAPRFGWVLESDHSRVVQAWYRIRVASDASCVGVVWDSGVVQSSKSQQISYAGTPLAHGCRYYWEVECACHAGTAGTRLETCTSEVSWFETALAPRSWSAVFIAKPSSADPENVESGSRPFYLRTDFCADTTPVRARVYSTAMGLYALYLNGSKVGDDLLTPGWTSYHKRLLYQVHDVSAMIRPGMNTLAAIVAPGWYAGDLTWLGKRNFYGNHTGFSAVLEMTDSAGNMVSIVADQNWKAGWGPLQYAELYHGERYDARLEIPGWNLPGFDDGDWEHATAVPCPCEVVAQDGVGVRCQERIGVREIITTPNGEQVLDFGQNLTGWVSFTVRGKAGETVRLRHAEILDANGNFYVENMRSARNTVEYVLRESDGDQSFSPHFSFQGFRYVRLDSWPGVVVCDDFQAVVIHSDCRQTLSFACSHPLLNQLHHNILWSWKGNSVDIPTDCPQRDERLGWTGDAQIFSATASYLTRAGVFFRKWLRDLAADQMSDGGMPFVVPDVLTHVLQSDPLITKNHSSSGWGDAAVVCPWTIYEFFGDLDLLREQYPSMCRWVEYIHREAEDGVVWNTGFHFGDWVALDAQPGSFFGATPSDLVATAWYARSLDLTARAAAVLGEDSDARRFRTLRDAVAAAFAARFITPEGLLAARTQTAYVLALVAGLIPDRYTERCADELVALIDEHGGHLTTGFLGTPWLLRALSEQGRWAEAFELLCKEDFPSWLYQVRMGATTVWEHWDGMREDGTLWDPSMNSFNHYSYGAVGQWIYEHVGGLAPDVSTLGSMPDGSASSGCGCGGAALVEGSGLGDAIGWQSPIIAPMLSAQVNSCSMSYESLYGVHAVSWAVSGSEFVLEVRIPCNTKAVVKLPSAVHLVADADGLEFAKVSGLLQATAYSGVYRITCLL